MTNDNKHRANAPEQEITSETPEYAAEMAETTLESSGRPKATMPEPEAPLTDDENGEEASASVDSSEDADLPVESESDEHEAHTERETPKLERLQKILAQAGIASRRHAEELITEGRVQVNGQTVTVLGSKADPQRDHIRVDGKLLHGAERLRYFVLNKPRGYVTTVTDPEGRPTVMQFFAKSGERLYPVGRLDYQSEGLLLVTNDGELANKLTRAASGVEKTYLVKIAGRPDEEQLERLRTGIAIDKGKPRSGKVHTAPAQIRQIRKGDNPWFEVVLIEGRNRELRKMFEEIGHHVEKIRRVGYGPLMLDVEPGKIRELEAREVEALHLTADGKLKPRRPKASHMLPKDAGKPAEERDSKTRRFDRRPDSQGREREFPQRDRRGPDDRPKFSERPRSGEGPKFGERPKFAGPPRGPSDRVSRDERPSRPFRPSGDRPGRFERGPAARDWGRPLTRGGESYGSRDRRAKPEGRSSETRGGRGAQRPVRGERAAGPGFRQRESDGERGRPTRRPFGKPDAREREDRDARTGSAPRDASSSDRGFKRGFGSSPSGAKRGGTFGRGPGRSRTDRGESGPSRSSGPGSAGPGSAGPGRGPKRGFGASAGGRSAGPNRGAKRGPSSGPTKPRSGGPKRGPSSGPGRPGRGRNFGGRQK
jgi:23S rRNA pseudouridine2605 synthase